MASNEYDAPGERLEPVSREIARLCDDSFFNSSLRISRVQKESCFSQTDHFIFKKLVCETWINGTFELENTKRLKCQSLLMESKKLEGRIDKLKGDQTVQDLSSYWSLNFSFTPCLS